MHIEDIKALQRINTLTHASRREKTNYILKHLDDVQKTFSRPYPRCFKSYRYLAGLAASEFEALFAASRFDALLAKPGITLSYCNGYMVVSRTP